MRRRGRSYDYGPRSFTTPHSTSGSSAGYPEVRPFRYSEVPEAWRKHALEPWRILFPDLDWKPLERE